jgi:ABC-type nitrate/sulfonate/bicarbonate transport system permease component
LALGAILILSILAIALFEIIVLIEKIVCPWYGSEQQH